MSTIASISTAPGIGGIGIIRMSGENTFKVLDKIFKAKSPKNIEEIAGYTIKYGHIVDEEKIIDEVLVSYFKAPKSYTTEDMCEINSHGGSVIINKILDICIRNGAEIAEPGEFTKRAFLNGRIDLTQAESVIDIINAKSDREAKEGIKQLEGFLTKKIKSIKDIILEIITNIEVSIDYPEYDTPELIDEQLIEKIDKSMELLKDLEKSFENGKIIKEGIKTVIIGKPNAGKSSLLNMMLNEERAIVTEYEGTTRDTIEEFININGIPLKLIDTAGIRETDNEVEKIGIDKSIKLVKNADLIIAIIDSSKELTKEDDEILKLVDPNKTILIFNKIDIGKIIDENDVRFNGFNNIVKISALKEIGKEDLYKKISELFNFNKINFDNDVIITNKRHQYLIKKAYNHLKESKESISNKMPIDIVAIGIRDVLIDLGEITGEEVGEEIINEIFSRFCLGK